jgi:hypothetical protein
MCPKWPLFFRVSDHSFVCISHFPPLVSFPKYLILIRLNTPITFDEQRNLRSFALYSFKHPPVTFFVLGPTILFSAVITHFPTAFFLLGPNNFTKKIKQQRLLVLVS